MATTKINTGKVIDASAKASAAQSTTANVGMAVSSIRRNVDNSILSRNDVGTSFTSAQNAISQIAKDIAKIYQMANSAAGQYESTEAGILNEGKRIGLIINVPNTSGQGSGNKASYEALFDVNELHLIKSGMSVDEYLKEIGKKPEGKTDENGEESKEGASGLGEAFFDAIGKMGILGTTADGIADMISGFDKGSTKTDMYKALLGGGAKFVESFGDLAAAAYDTKAFDVKENFMGDWEKGGALKKIGIDDITTATKGDIFEHYLDDFVDGFNFSKATNVGEKIKVGTQWAGVAFSVAGNAVENLEEFGTVASGRFWGETVIETAVDVGLGVITGAAATVVLGASAPAVAVGAATIGITWVVNKASEAITGKGVDEFFADVVMDGVEKVADVGKSAFNGIKDAIGNIGVKWGECFG